jgi:hypothetical protein
MSALLAVNWEWELRGTLIVIIAVTVLCGSIYLILATNMGARLGFLVALAGLAGWMFLMGAVWWTYGKGLLGPDSTWKPVAGKTVIQSNSALSGTGVLDVPFTGSGNPTDDAEAIETVLTDGGWRKLDSALPTFQQAGSAGGVFLEQAGAFAAGEFQVINVFERGGERGPQLLDGKLDFIAFSHKPLYSLVEVAPLLPQRTEPGRAPARPVIDASQPHQYVYMVRDLGSKRKPAGIITISSLTLFLTLCWLLHRRDRVVAVNRAAKALPAKA